MSYEVPIVLETPITFKDSGGSAVITLQNLAASAGRISAQYDRGAGILAPLCTIRASVPFETAPIVGEAVRIYVATSDGTNVDGTVGTSDAALTSTKLANLMLVGNVVVDTTSVDTVVTGTFQDVPITTRYFSIGVFNGTADNLQDDANTAVVTVTFYTPQVQVP